MIDPIDVGPTLYKCYTNVLCLLGQYILLNCAARLRYIYHNTMSIIWLTDNGFLSLDGLASMLRECFKEVSIKIKEPEIDILVQAIIGSDETENRICFDEFYEKAINYSGIKDQSMLK